MSYLLLSYYELRSSKECQRHGNKKIKMIKRFLGVGFGEKCDVPTDTGTYLLAFVVCENNYKYVDFRKNFLMCFLI